MPPVRSAFQDPGFRPQNNPYYAQVAPAYSPNHNSPHIGHGGSANPMYGTQPQARAPNRADREWYQDLQPRQPYNRRDDPYDAEGFVRRDGAVNNEDEVYEEYRLSGEYER